MAENVTIARPYAEAVFALADAGGALGRWSQTLAVMAAVAANPELRAAIGNPNLSADQVYGLFAGACGDARQRGAEFRARTDRERPACDPARDPRGLSKS